MLVKTLRRLAIPLLVKAKGIEEAGHTSAGMGIEGAGYISGIEPAVCKSEAASSVVDELHPYCCLLAIVPLVPKLCPISQPQKPFQSFLVLPRMTQDCGYHH